MAVSRVVVTIACVLAFQISASASDKYALLIAINKYDHAEMNKPQLEFPETDARALGALLELSGYAVDYLLGREATQIAIREKLEALRRQGNSDGVVLLGFFGHGIETHSGNSSGNEAAEGCFCPFDTSVRIAKDGKGQVVFGDDGKPLSEPDPDSLVKLSEVLTFLTVAKARHRVVLADCCRTTPHKARGRSFGSGFKAKDLPDNTSVIFGCSPDEQAFEHRSWGHGAFTKCLLDAIAGLSKSEEVDTARLAGILKRTVPELVATVAPRETQTPKLFSTDVVNLRLKVEGGGKGVVRTLTQARERQALAREILNNIESKSPIDIKNHNQAERLIWNYSQLGDVEKVCALLARYRETQLWADGNIKWRFTKDKWVWRSIDFDTIARSLSLLNRRSRDPRLKYEIDLLREKARLTKNEHDDSSYAVDLGWARADDLPEDLKNLCLYKNKTPEQILTNLRTQKEYEIFSTVLETACNRRLIAGDLKEQWLPILTQSLKRLLEKAADNQIELMLIAAIENKFDDALRLLQQNGGSLYIEPYVVVPFALRQQVDEVNQLCDAAANLDLRTRDALPISNNMKVLASLILLDLGLEEAAIRVHSTVTYHGFGWLTVGENGSVGPKGARSISILVSGRLMDRAKFEDFLAREIADNTNVPEDQRGDPTFRTTAMALSFVDGLLMDIPDSMVKR
jgi:hypothetical protein